MILKKKNDLIIVIPVFNEEDVISIVVKQWLKAIRKLNAIIIIVNDGSTDNTLNNLKNIASKKIKIFNIKNSGHGRALLKGYNEALKLNPSYIFQVDSDNQFSTKNFIKFWKNRNYFDFQYGYRFNRKDPVLRLIITRILKYLLFLFFGTYVTDSNVPYRLMKADKLRNIVKKRFVSKNIPNVFLSIYFTKYHTSNYYIVIHKERKTGKVWIIKFKLLKFCIESFLDLIKLRLKI